MKDSSEKFSQAFNDQTLEHINQVDKTADLISKLRAHTATDR